jgi:hypothetical protein
MKRSFLFGLGTFLVMGVLVGFFRHDVTSIAIALVCMPLSVMTIRAAQRAEPHFSRLRAFFGWLLGFFVVDVVLGGIGFVIYTLSRL